MSVKTLPERLRETADALESSNYGIPECVIREKVYGECDRDVCTCKRGECLSRLLNLIAYDIDSGYIRAPRFDEDATGASMRRQLETWICESAESYTAVSVNLEHGEPEVLNVCGELRSIPSEYVTLQVELRRNHPKQDTLEAIEKDVELETITYCQKHDIVPEENEYRFYSFAKSRDLLRRQRAVLERDAPKAEERTCRNENCTGVPFICSECGFQHTQPVNYCPHCGARVVG